ncbi:MAG: phycobilisome rod-core linker polypeptide CpcG [Cyanothece sp. SIO2G6]|nr:phycobilisome rod-core linker polypeptide CpcG [Cyanothece sp. SIO2G6]
MAIPLLEYSYSTQNSRVPGYEVPGDEQARIWDTQMLLSDGDIDNLIEAAYRQIFFHAFESDREPFLESQLRSGQITVRDFVRGLLLSETFNRSFYGLNSNYRFVEQCVQRALGRDIYDEREKLAWSIVVATKGRVGFVNDLLDSEEYLSNFGDNILPYQRRRVLPGRAEGELPFNIKSPRYDEYYRAKLGFPKLVFSIIPRKADDATKSWGTKAGDPSLYLNMVRSLGVLPTGIPETSAENVDFTFSKVPYRKKF